MLIVLLAIASLWLVRSIVKKNPESELPPIDDYFLYGCIPVFQLYVPVAEDDLVRSKAFQGDRFARGTGRYLSVQPG
jgi:hypothetical protein